MKNLKLTPFEQLKKDGFCVLEQVFSEAFVYQLAQHALALVKHQTETEKNKLRSLGSLISLWQDPFFASLIAHPAIINALKSVGAGDIRYSNGYLLAKPPHSVPTFWHQDWWLWSDPDSYKDAVHQIGVLCYLQDVNKNNGALRVIPGSHRQAHPLHPILKSLDNDELRRAEHPDTEPYKAQPDEVGLLLKEGDIVLMDARLLHSAYANQSNQCRYGLTLWYYPNYNLLSEAIKARIGTVCLDPLWANQLKKMNSLLPCYSGDAMPEVIITHPEW